MILSKHPGRKSSCLTFVTFLTAPESSLTTCVKSAKIVSKDFAFRRFSKTRTAFLGRRPLRSTAMILGLIGALGSPEALPFSALLVWPKLLECPDCLNVSRRRTPTLPEEFPAPPEIKRIKSYSRCLKVHLYID